MALVWEYWWLAAAALAAAVAGGAMNALAGGGTIVIFPTLVALGLPPVNANATSSVAIWPASFGGTWGFRREILEADRWWLWLIIPSIVGGALGALLLVNLPSQLFSTIAPYLVLASTIIISLNQPIERLARASLGGRSSSLRRAFALLLQLVVATYGGYFGAGLGILILTALGLVGVADIRQADGLKNLFTIAIRGVAVALFVFLGVVVWNVAVLMLIGSTIGGYWAATLGRWVEERVLRAIIVAIGLGMTAAMFVRLGG